jgi:hypothetical protein
MEQEHAPTEEDNDTHEDQEDGEEQEGMKDGGRR